MEGNKGKNIALSLVISMIKQEWRNIKEKFGFQNSSYSHSTQTITVNDIEFKMIKVDGGSFMMGATPKQMSDAYADEKPAHKVTLSEFYIGEFPVTQELWKALMGFNPSLRKFGGDKNPVNNVSWNKCDEFIKKLNEKTVNSRPQGMVFRLPTEAEWEYAARGGCKACGEDLKYSGSDNIDEVAWYKTNSSGQVHPVDKNPKRANQLEIYDMSGNVWEWCYDGMRAYDSKEQSNPVGPCGSSDRVLRGGAWYLGASSCRVSKRHSFAPGCSCHVYSLLLCLGKPLN